MSRSIKQLLGDPLGASDGDIGHVKDFYFDDKSWTIGELIVKTGHLFSSNEVLIPVSKVDRISYEKSTVFLNLTKEAV
jgi:sporulation protein YlmC with PRC-barrel domain